MDIYRSRIAVVLVINFCLILVSCKTGNQNFYRYNKMDFAQVEIRYGEGQNEKCVIVLTSEGLIIRESKNLNEAENSYHFIPIVKIDSAKLEQVQRTIKDNGYFVHLADQPPRLTSFVNSRITTIWNPITNTSITVRDGKYYDRTDDRDGMLLDELWTEIIDLIPSDYLEESICWKDWGVTWGGMSIPDSSSITEKEN